MTSLSTRFLGQPRLTKWMVFFFIGGKGGRRRRKVRYGGASRQLRLRPPSTRGPPAGLPRVAPLPASPAWPPSRPPSRGPPAGLPPRGPPAGLPPRGPP